MPLTIDLDPQALCQWDRTRVAGVYLCRCCGYLTRPYDMPPERIRRRCGCGWRFRGLGDTVAWLIHRASFGLLRPCAACLGRRDWLNALLPYGRPWAWWRRRLARAVFGQPSAAVDEPDGRQQPQRPVPE